MDFCEKNGYKKVERKEQKKPKNIGGKRIQKTSLQPAI